ncbi:hypothetical protein AADZ90_018755 [Aestuariibius sp. 2305UL40-4]|uniref:hypothetical protein n=1 Tax=Aestuariibius violaceus TaxID=3234132 RepID=UPI00345E58D3
MRRESPLRWIEAFGFSLLFHAGILAALVGIYRQAIFISEARENEVEIVVTNVAFDTAFLDAEDGAGGDPETVDGTEPDGADAVEADAPEEAEAEVAETVEPEAPEEADAEPSETAESETADPVEPEETQSIEDQIAGLEPEPVAPITPESSPSPILPDQNLIAVAPVQPQAERVAAVTGTGSSNVDDGGPGAGRIAPVAPRTTIAAPSAIPTAQPAAEPSPEARTVNALVQRIREQLADACLVALPQRTGDGGARLTLIAPDEETIQSFSQAVLPGLEPQPSERDVLIDTRQCAAVRFIREQPDYPVGRLSIVLASDRVESGGRLIGAISGAAGRYVTLLLVDDNGVVQDLNRFLTFVGGETRFDVPVTRSGPPRDTGQILLALATSGRPSTIEERGGQLAEDVFPPLSEELGENAVTGMIPFSVR